MDVELMLCDHAQVSGNKLFISGANIDRIAVPSAADGPFPIAVCVAGLVHVPWNLTNEEHALTLELLDADGRPAPMPEGAPAVRGEMTFTVGRPPQLTPGDSQSVPFVFAFMGLPIARRGRYEFALSLNGAPLRSVRLTLE